MARQVTEICIDDNDIPQAEGIFSTSQIFRPVRACYTMDPYIRFQSTWSVTPRTIIFLPSSCFFDDSCIQEYPEHIERPGASFPYTCSGLDPLLFPDPHGLFVSLVNRRVAIRDTLSGQAAKRLFDAGILDLPWIKSLQWSLQQHEVSMTLINERCDRDHDECGFRNTRDSTAIIRQTSADGSVQVKIEDEDTNQSEVEDGDIDSFYGD